MKQRLDKHFLLNRAFVGTLLAIAVPIALQNMISFGVAVMDSVMLGSFGDVAIAAANLGRSEERRVGKECRIGCRSRWSPYH